MMGPDATNLVFCMLSFKPTFSLYFTFIKKLLSSSWVNAIRVVSSAYLWLLIFLLAILIPATAFHIMYSVYKLNKQGDNIQPSCTPFPTWNHSIVPCTILTVACWSAHRFQGSGKVVWYSHLFKNFPQFVVIHAVIGFHIVNKAEIDVFFSVTLLLFLWSNRCWQVDLWFLRLF